MNLIRAYFDAWSEIYDAELRENPGEDVDLYRRQARRVDGPVLEIGCGTGRIYLELLDDGIEAYGIDVSSEMLDRLREKAEDRGLTPTVERADMADFEFDRRFSLVIIPSATFLYNLTIETQLATLENVKSVLTDDGEVILSYYTPDIDTICNHYGTEMVTEIPHEGETCTLRSRISFVDEVERIIRIEKTLHDADGNLIADAECQAKLLPKREMELLLQRAGFEDYRAYGGFDCEELTPESDHMLWFTGGSTPTER